MDIYKLLSMGIEKRASDLHITRRVPPIVRIDGEIVSLPFEPLSADSAEQLTYSLLDSEQIEQLERTRRLSFSKYIDGLGYFRVTAYTHQGRAECAVRIGLREVQSLEELGHLPVVAEVTRSPWGLILITGPAGTGKTTTFNSMIDLINREQRKKIVTVEDPVEFRHSPKRCIVVQQEVFTDTQDVRGALIHILRQDPDVIGVGEMRDLDTIGAALTAAETGHLVIATLHTPTASQSVDRIVDAFPPGLQAQTRAQLSGCLKAVIAQQLLPRLKGTGRILASEVMLGSIAVLNIIREGKTHQLFSQMEMDSRMRTMDRSLLDLYERGLISADQAITRARFPEHVRKAIEGEPEEPKPDATWERF